MSPGKRKVTEVLGPQASRNDSSYETLEELTSDIVLGEQVMAVSHHLRTRQVLGTVRGVRGGRVLVETYYGPKLYVVEFDDPMFSWVKVVRPSFSAWYAERYGSYPNLGVNRPAYASWACAGELAMGWQRYAEEYPAAAAKRPGWGKPNN